MRCAISRKSPLRFAALSAAMLLASASIASAHFVWIDSTTEGEKTLIKSGFGEPGGWDPDLIDKISATVYSVKSKSGLKKLDMKLDTVEKEYRTTIEGAAPAAIVGTTDYGVVQFGPSPAGYLRYTAKRLLGDPQKWNDSATSSLRIELVAKFAGDHVDLQALYLGKPAADAKIKATLPNGDEVEMVTDAKGRAIWQLAGPGNYGCYLGVKTPKEGTHGEKKYAVLMDYTTLSFTVAK
ncbi:MAG: hypothetical protein C0483_15620 [Pirellula sp.]|nr:hypothetical protein [Pirellula sp.]